ncbi:unnamed protein product [Rotaria sp. Silwood1]|nr:unnamed protein product [Rotaria sp. Silwood1]CAF1619328.1 unnamed protein product [Rotaria sp. Silwood1]CAF3721317.1 unnamed protein product [Rotaria sp. Silwood1]CAF3795925.1 unnamed protein product [Rotaria sp. Silwood1]CAF4817859.1 unnamed protein product [Rotaria sp. Silwood1]
MDSDSSIFDETISDISLLHLSHSNILIFNFSSSSSSIFENDTIITSYDIYRHLTEIIVYKYICLTIFVIGVIGNLLSVLVFSRASLRHRSCAIYFLALAITDIASLFASFIDTVLPSYNNVSLTIKYLFICKLNPLMVYFTTDLSNFLLAIASIDRAVSIQCPLKSKQFCRARIAIYIIIIISFALLIINSHIFWGFEIIDEQSQKICLPSKIKIVYYNEPNSLTYDRFYAIFDSLDMLFAVLIPFIVMLICNIIILIRVITSRRSISTVLSTTVQSKKSRKRHEKERQLTVMLLGSAAAFLVFTLPTEINDTVRAFRPSNLSQPKGAMALMTAVFIAMEQLNHAIHFYIYTLTGRVFRNELIQLFTFSKYTSLTQQKSSSSLRRMTNDHQLNSLLKQKTNHDDT